MGGLVHDYAYKYATLKRKGKGTWGVMTQKEADKFFLDINIEQNGFHFLNYLAYWALRLVDLLRGTDIVKVNAKVK